MSGGFAVGQPGFDGRRQPELDGGFDRAIDECEDKSIIKHLSLLFSTKPSTFFDAPELEPIKTAAKEVDRILMLTQEFAKFHYDGEGVPREYRKAYKALAREVHTDMLAQAIANTLEELYGVIAVAEMKD